MEKSEAKAGIKEESLEITTDKEFSEVMELVCFFRDRKIGQQEALRMLRLFEVYIATIGLDSEN